MVLVEYHGFKVSDDGQIYDKKGLKKTYYYNNGGYATVSMYYDGCAHTHLVHRIIAEVFIDNPDNYNCVSHINGDNSDNHAENLQWTSREMQYARTHQKTVATEIVCEDTDGNLINTYRSLAVAARAVGVYPATISNYISGKQIDKRGYIWKKQQIHRKNS